MKLYLKGQPFFFRNLSSILAFFTPKPPKGGLKKRLLINLYLLIT
jgi:hypothetical protein